MRTLLGVEQSFGGRRWIQRDIDEERERALARAANISPTLAGILAARNIGTDEASSYLNPLLKTLLPEPFLLKDMEKAVARAFRAIRDGERIAIFGDYDVDGSCSAALLHEFLDGIGRTPVLYIPDRMKEGYGPSAEALLGLQAGGAQLVITADCGATANAALAAARGAGLDVVVLDHHATETAEIPALAHVNPNQPGDASGQSQLCAAGVAFLFVVALNRCLRGAGWYASQGIAAPELLDLIDLVALATVCDVVPLAGVNRAFVRAGLARIAAAPRPGIRALAEITKSEAPFSPFHLGYVFGPRINAGGRVGSCRLGVDLLIARTGSAAGPLAMQLERHNRERQAIEHLMLEEAMIDAGSQDNAPFIFVSREGWHSGVVGIIAGRLKDRFGKPALAVGFEGGQGRGSARSVAGFDIGAAIRAARDARVIESGGGHTMAAGFSLTADRIGALQGFLLRRFEQLGSRSALGDPLELQGIVSAAGATPSLVAEIGRAGPFGAGNPEPVLAAPDMRVAFADTVGHGHVRLGLQGPEGTRLNAIAFRAVGSPLGEALLKSRGARIHAAGTLKAERWNGKERVQLHLQDAAAAGV